MSTHQTAKDPESAEARDKTVKRCYYEANGDALVLNKWFAVQARADVPNVLDRVEEFTKHPDFTFSIQINVDHLSLVSL